MPTLEMQNTGISFSIDSIISRKDPPKEANHLKPLIQCNTRVRPVSDGRPEQILTNYTDNCLDPTRDFIGLENNEKTTQQNSPETESSLGNEESTEDSQLSEYFVEFFSLPATTPCREKNERDFNCILCLPRVHI